MPLTAGTIKCHSCTLSPSPGSEGGALFLLLYSETSNYCESLLNKSAERLFQQHHPPPPVLQQLRPTMVLQQPKMKTTNWTPKIKSSGYGNVRLLIFARLLCCYQAINMSALLIHTAHRLLYCSFMIINQVFTD